MLPPKPPLIGLDLEQPARLAASLARQPRLAERLFTAGERAYAKAQPDPTLHLAARFCAKEAVAKALGLEGFAPKEIEVTGGGAEVGLQLHGEAAARAKQLGVEVTLSMSHNPQMAGAVALASRRLYRSAGRTRGVEPTSSQ